MMLSYICKYYFVTILQQAMSSEEEQIEDNNINAIKLMTDKNINETRMAAAGRLSFDLVSMIEQEIQADQFQVNQVQKEFKLKHKQNKDESKKNTEVTGKRYQTSEDGQKNTNAEYGQPIQSTFNQRKYYKSQMTPEDIEKIRTLKLLQKKHEMELENKAKFYEQSLKKFQQEERQLLERQKKEKNEERLKEVAKNIQQIRNRQEQRKRKMEEQKKRLLQIKHQKKLYERLDEKYKSVEIQQEKKKEEIKLALKAQKTLHLDDIKQHEKKYDDIMRAQREQRQKKLGQLVRGNSKRYYQSHLLKGFIEQQEKAKAQHIQKKNQAKQHFLKKQEYAEYVRNKYKPNVQLNEDGQQVAKPPPQPPLPASRSISVNQLYKMGNDYMRQAHQSVQNLKGSSVSKVEKKEEPFKYKNYLQEIKAERKPSSQKEPRYLQQIDTLLKKENMTQEQKFYKAKMLAQKIEEKKGRDSQKLIQSINAKIHLLKHIPQ